jgi:hypothetical protein
MSPYWKPIVNIKRDNDKLTLFALNHARVVSDFLIALQDGRSKGFESFSLIFDSEIRGAYPNTCAPLAGIIEYYKKQGIDIYSEKTPEFIEVTYLLSPLKVSENENILKQAPLNKVWRFENSSDINSLVIGFVEEVSKQAVCQEGVIEGLEWCLNEIMDNVLQHSSVSNGYIMGQIHKSTQHIAFCIFDTGQGIFNSLRHSKHAPRNPIDAITLAVKEGVTRDSKIGQGNGMWGLHNVVKENSGVLVITSNSASYMLREDEIKTFKNLPVISRELGSATIDFQIDFDKGISLPKALGNRPINLRLEALEDDRGNISYRVSERSSGTGTRQSGERMRNEIINIYRETERIIEIDFQGISVISSSFADELIGKLVAEYGLFGFMQIFKLKNMNEIIQSIANRSVSQRMVVTFAPDSSDE